MGTGKCDSSLTSFMRLTASDDFYLAEFAMYSTALKKKNNLKMMCGCLISSGKSVGQSSTRPGG